MIPVMIVAIGLVSLHTWGCWTYLWTCGMLGCTIIKHSDYVCVFEKKFAEADASHDCAAI